MEASLHGYEAEGLVGGKRVARRRWRKNNETSRKMPKFTILATAIKKVQALI